MPIHHTNKLRRQYNSCLILCVSVPNALLCTCMCNEKKTVIAIHMGSISQTWYPLVIVDLRLLGGYRKGFKGLLSVPTSQLTLRYKEICIIY